MNNGIELAGSRTSYEHYQGQVEILYDFMLSYVSTNAWFLSLCDICC